MQEQPQWRQQILQQQQFFTNCCCGDGGSVAPPPGFCTHRKVTFDGKIVWNSTSNSGEYDAGFEDPDNPFAPATTNTSSVPQAVRGISCNNASGSEDSLVWTLGYRAVEQFNTRTGVYIKGLPAVKRRGFYSTTSNTASAAQLVRVTATNVHPDDKFRLTVGTDFVEYTATSSSVQDLMEHLSDLINAKTTEPFLSLNAIMRLDNISFDISGPDGIPFTITPSTTGYAQDLIPVRTDSTHLQIFPVKVHAGDTFILTGVASTGPTVLKSVQYTAALSTSHDVVVGLRAAIAASPDLPFTTFTTAEDVGGDSFTITGTSVRLDTLTPSTVDNDVPRDNTQTLTVELKETAVQINEIYRRENKWYPTLGVCLDSNPIGASWSESFVGIHFRFGTSFYTTGWRPEEGFQPLNSGGVIHGFGDIQAVTRVKNDFTRVWGNATQTVVYGEYFTSSHPNEFQDGHEEYDWPYITWNLVNNCTFWFGAFGSWGGVYGAFDGTSGYYSTFISCASAPMQHGTETVHVEAMAPPPATPGNDAYWPRFTWYGAMNYTLNADIDRSFGGIYWAYENGSTYDFNQIDQTPPVSRAGNHKATAIRTKTVGLDAYASYTWSAGGAYIPRRIYADSFEVGFPYVGQDKGGFEVMPDGDPNWVERWAGPVTAGPGGSGTVQGPIDIYDVLWRVQVTRYEQVLGMVVPLGELSTGGTTNVNRLFVFGSGFGVGHIITILDNDTGAEVGTIADNPGDHITSMSYLQQYNRMLVTRESGMFSVYSDNGVLLWYAYHGAPLYCSCGSQRNAGTSPSNAHFYIGGGLAATGLTVTHLDFPPGVTTYP